MLAKTSQSKEMAKPPKSVVESPASVAPAGSAPPRLFPAGYKTPLSLLNERCQKMGWHPPVVDSRRISGGKGFTSVVTLRKLNPKTNAIEEVVLRPPGGDSPIRIEKEIALEARHWGAIYALFRFANNLRLSLTLPPTCRPYWSLLETEKKNTPKHLEWLWSTDPFAAAAANAAKATESTKTQGQSNMSDPATGVEGSKAVKRLPTRWAEAPSVHMSPKLRNVVEELISKERERIGGNDEDEEDMFTEEDEELIMDTTRLLNELLGMGFRLGQVDAAIKAAKKEARGADIKSIREAALVYLQTYVPEEDLPVSFKAHKPKQNTIRLFQSGDSTALALGWLADRMNRESGFPLEIIEQVLRDLLQDREDRTGEVDRLEAMAYFRLGQMMVAQDEGMSDSLAEESMWEEEKEIVKSLLEDERVEDDGVGKLNIMILSPNGKKKMRAKDDVTLRIFHSHYPSPGVHPSFYVYSSTLPAYIKVHLTYVLLQKITEDESLKEIVAFGQGGVITELVHALDNFVHGVISHPPQDARKVFEPLYGKKEFRFVSESFKRGTESKQKRWKREFERVQNVEMENERLLKDWKQRREKVGWEKMGEVRRKLPAWKSKEEIVDVIQKNRVVIVAGDTGSGKTTQVPSYILEDAILSQSGASAFMICTQPRRVSAIGVATRVAQELEENIENITPSSLVGYSIRGTKKAGKGCRLLFCTTGVLLARLSRGGDLDLEGVSHVFVDEVHERSTDSDFLLLELREMLKRNTKLKVILMSATINQQFFSDYFGGAPCINIPGFTHPVQDFYLEDVVDLVKYHSTSAKPTVKMAQEQIDRMRSTFQKYGVKDIKALNALEMLVRYEKTDYELLAALVNHIVNDQKTELPKEGKMGGILCFLPGVAEIKMAVDAIKTRLGNQNFKVLPLHSNLSNAEQVEVFKAVPKGCVKIVCATNIAETSITIDDIVYVIDTGRVKETKFDSTTGVTRLVEGWTSLAASKQRRGRAGRTQPGVCYKLFSHWTAETTMLPQSIPEILRMPLENLSLQIKSMREHVDVKEYLSLALDPPESSAIDVAWETLEAVGAVQDGGMSSKLTPLGRYLALLPMDLRLGKMILLASIFGCLDPILTVVAILSNKPLFNNPLEARDEAKAARMKFFKGNSDLLTDAHAYNEVLRIRREEGMSAMRRFCNENFISPSTVRDISTLRQEFLQALETISGPLSTTKSTTSKPISSEEENLLRSIIFAGLGLMKLCKIKLPNLKFEKSSGGNLAKEMESREVKIFEREERVFLHPASTLFTFVNYTSPFLTYFSKSVTTKPFLRDGTEVPTYGILLFGGNIRSVDVTGGGLVVFGKNEKDDFVRFRAWSRIGVLVNQLRRLLDAELQERFEYGSIGDVSETSVVEVMKALLRVDGME